MSLSDRELEALATRVMDAAFAVHRALGPAFPESFYERAMMLELAAKQIPAQSQAPVDVFFRGERIGEGRIDILVDRRIVLELKVGEPNPRKHAAQVRSYLAATRLQLGFAINFSQPLLKDSIHRVIMTNHPPL